MAFFDQYASRLNEAAMQHLSDGTATYTPASGPALLAVPYQLDLSHEVYDQDQVAMRVAT